MTPLPHGLACHHGVRRSPSSNLPWPRVEDALDVALKRENSREPDSGVQCSIALGACDLEYLTPDPGLSLDQLCDPGRVT